MPKTEAFLSTATSRGGKRHPSQPSPSTHLPSSRLKPAAMGWLISRQQQCWWLTFTTKLRRRCEMRALDHLKTDLEWPSLTMVPRSWSHLWPIHPEQFLFHNGTLSCHNPWPNPKLIRLRLVVPVLRNLRYPSTASARYSLIRISSRLS